MTICDCNVCECWMPVFIDGETQCYACIHGYHLDVEDEKE